MLLIKLLSIIASIMKFIYTIIVLVNDLSYDKFKMNSIRPSSLLWRRRTEISPRQKYGRATFYMIAQDSLHQDIMLFAIENLARHNCT